MSRLDDRLRAVDGLRISTAIVQETFCCAASRVAGEPRCSRSPADPLGSGDGVGGLGTRWMIVSFGIQGTSAPSALNRILAARIG